ncbi:MAG: hypothetical protein PHR35_09680 [Kiritimatiellae bacterium]|nr:hypothetical protein [Kiritimatiellia bacterium]
MTWLSDFYIHHRTLLLWSIWSSAAMLALMLAVVPLTVALLPRDYFSHQQRHRVILPPPRSRLHRVGVLAKNIAGGLLVLCGLVMFFGPGQGSLAVLAGLMLMNFPGKYRLERWLVRRQAVWRGLCWVRRRTGKPPLEPPAGPSIA